MRIPEHPTVIRRMLDQVATWSYTRRTASASESKVVHIVVEAAEHMARERVGALATGCPGPGPARAYLGMSDRT